MNAEQETTRPWREAAALLVDAEAALHMSWSQGDGRSGNAPCLVAALDDAAWSAGTVPAPLTASWSAPAFRLAREIIAEQLGRTPDNADLTSWNDDPDTEFEDVLAVVRSAAVRAGTHAGLGENWEAVHATVTTTPVTGDRTTRTTDQGSPRLAALHTFGDWWVELADLGPGPAPDDRDRPAGGPGYDLMA